MLLELQRRIIGLLAVPLVAGCGNLWIDLEAQHDALVPAPAVDAGRPDGWFSDAGTTAACGNAIPEANEQCDDGNDTSADGCEKNCQASFLLSGQISYLDTPPPSLDRNAFESAEILLIRERQDEILLADFPVDAFTPPMQVVPSTAQGGSVPAGSRVNVYLLHFEALPEVEGVSVTGTVAFPYDIVGIVSRPANLAATDLPGITYESAPGRGIEAVSAGDAVVYSAREVQFTATNSTRADEIRLVVATDEPHGISVLPE